ncbi:MAG: hypothetical protein BJ554DRAFT_8051 [Olpidium bornovanus]|uniref:Copper transport protein n=1 Tax=Olpidium bornovanus TaxID=278681 RepID=A0A8H8DJC8_9FUNG|nr:MAG: hypothetical protein BJ554DRAFT_8051 [Olpidium bornovanus]
MPPQPPLGPARSPRLPTRLLSRLLLPLLLAPPLATAAANGDGGSTSAAVVSMDPILPHAEIRFADAFACPTTSPHTPQRPYFHVDIRDYFLLRCLVPLNAGHYFCACLVTFLLAMGRVAIQVVTPRFESRWCDAELCSSSTVGHETYRRRLDRLAVAARRALWSTLSLLVSTLIMLVMMSFNLGFFLAALLGHFVGVFFISGWSGAADAARMEHGGSAARIVYPDLATSQDQPERLSYETGDAPLAGRD